MVKKRTILWHVWVLRGVMGGQVLLTAKFCQQATIKTIFTYHGRDDQLYKSKRLILVSHDG